MPVAVARGKHWESDEVTLVSTRYVAPKLSTECFLLLPAKSKEILMILGDLWNYGLDLLNFRYLVR